MLGLRKAVLSRAFGTRWALVRKFTSSSSVREIQLFDMPSMSPTMEEGGIVEWKFKEGASFKSGDVLLEIETDKAEIAVEAADDGILAKILVESGVKGIAVGKPIAVTAEEGDNLDDLNLDALLAQRGSGKPEESSQQASNNNSVKPESSSRQSSASEPVSIQNSQPVHGKHGMEPLPAALRLMQEHKLSANDIEGSGPYGRITKGDILAHLGKIPKEYLSKEQARFNKLQKMDLSKVEAAPQKPSQSIETASPVKDKPKPIVSSVSIPLTASLVPKVASAQRAALRLALLSLKPKASVLRDPVFDALTASSRPPFAIKSVEVRVLRAKPVSLDVVVEEPPTSKPSKAVDVFFSVLRSELALPSA